MLNTMGNIELTLPCPSNRVLLYGTVQCCEEKRGGLTGDPPTRPNAKTGQTTVGVRFFIFYGMAPATVSGYRSGGRRHA